MIPLLLNFLEALLFTGRTASFKRLYRAQIEMLQQMGMVAYDSNITSVCHQSLMVYCGKPQTPQRDVAMRQEPHCRHWKTEQKSIPWLKTHRNICLLLFRLLTLQILPCQHSNVLFVFLVFQHKWKDRSSSKNLCFRSKNIKNKIDHSQKLMF